MIHDHQIDTLLERKGWYVIRFWGKEIEKKLNDCVNEVKEIIIQSKINLSDFNNFYLNNESFEETESIVAEQKINFINT